MGWEQPATRELDQAHLESTFDIDLRHGDIAQQWRLGPETVRLPVKDEPAVLKMRMDLPKSMTSKVNSLFGTGVLLTLNGRRCPN
ncbi:MAG: hypothetical protein WD696_03900 [Bryobacteraceae bacterium]